MVLVVLYPFRSLQGRTLILILLLTFGVAGVVERLVQSHRYRTRGSRLR